MNQTGKFWYQRLILRETLGPTIICGAVLFGMTAFIIFGSWLVLNCSWFENLN